MIFRIVLLLLAILPINGLAQDYAKVDRIVRSYPEKMTSTIDLANRIRTDFSKDTEKVRAIYQWLNLNIRYEQTNASFDVGDQRILFTSEEDLLRQLDYKRRKKIEAILRTNKAVCLGYSQIFKAICDHLNIESEIIFGYGKTNSNHINSDLEYKNHSWNAVKVNEQWQLLDITWSTLGRTTDFSYYGEYYFFVDPKELIRTHYPVNENWQLLENPISKTDFIETPIFYPKYFIDKFKIADSQYGLIKIDDKIGRIYFDQIPKEKKMLYTLDGEVYKPLMYKKTKKGRFVSSFKYKKSRKNNKNLTIYSNESPILSFAIH